MLESNNRYKIIDECVTHIEHNIQSNYNTSNQQLQKIHQQRDLGIITKDLKWQKQAE